MRHAARSCLFLISAVACALLAAPGASAAPLNLGQTGFDACGTFGYSLTQLGTAGGPAYAAPGDGLLTSWSVGADSDTGAIVKLRIFRPTSTPNLYLVLADSPDQGPLTPNMANGPFPISIPVKAGDLIGINIVAGTSPACQILTSNSDDVALQFLPDNADVGDLESSADTSSGEKANISATFVGPPVVSSVSPSSGPRTGGTKVTVNGHDLEGASAVSFGSQPAAGFTVDSDSRITATTPPGALGLVDVRVTTLVGQSAQVAADRFTFLEVCTVPKVKGKKLKPAKKKLSHGDCRIGKVKGDRQGKVKKQNPKPGVVLPVGGKVNVKLG